MLQRLVELAQYTSFAFTAHLIEAGIDASIGTVGDALDNALMESQIGLYKTELIKPRRPWHSLADVELGTAEWVDWFNNQRLHTAIGDIPPHEHETNHYAQHQPQPAGKDRAGGGSGRRIIDPSVGVCPVIPAFARSRLLTLRWVRRVFDEHAGPLRAGAGRRHADPSSGQGAAT